MTEAGWAEKKVAEKATGYHWNGRIRKSTVILPGIAAKLLKAEHARAIRIVKAVVKHAVHMEQKTKLNRELNAYWQGKLDGAENILAALQRGRGGKG